MSNTEDGSTTKRLMRQSSRDNRSSTLRRKDTSAPRAGLGKLRRKKKKHQKTKQKTRYNPPVDEALVPAVDCGTPARVFVVGREKKRKKETRKKTPKQSAENVAHAADLPLLSCFRFLSFSLCFSRSCRAFFLHFLKSRRALIPDCIY